eukprot:CAMPEP_0201188312 /NCGR_PEP_ID=MMETSP0851-20130426/135201_1 /ASSEMBLY_ACC=CAM_ASM_000631 /TAXON_ID=183588 /ORGANISM="Pseudo-nitzschia fraudulenta, Strain WWA7" /LENGTH=302 /DNA_ID=CAMNT_0047473915 /DNA_START=225 /DNA_END=1129 /DNA_ORIENTATION=-
MGKAAGKKKLRGSRGSRAAGSNKEYCDLMVTLPGAAGTPGVERKLLVREVKDRLESTGFTHMALTHTIYGRPRPGEDRAATALPASLWSATGGATGDGGGRNQRATKKRRPAGESSPGGTHRDRRREIKVLRRLHVVVENQSDMGLYLSNGPQEELLNGYDIVSIGPTNEATFRSACSSATMADLITLDYTGRGLKLPYKIRQADVAAATRRGAAFEIPVAPALLRPNQRKNLVHACQELKNGCLAAGDAVVVVSSGDRVLGGSDAGALALRTPGDLANLCKTVLRLGGETAARALGASAMG